MCLMSHQWQAQEPRHSLEIYLYWTQTKKNNHSARSRQQVHVKTLIKPDEVTKLFDDILQTSVVSEVDEERAEQNFAKLMDLTHKFEKSNMIALCKYHTMPNACIDDQGRAEHNIIKGIDSNLKSLMVHSHIQTQSILKYSLTRFKDCLCCRVWSRMSLVKTILQSTKQTINKELAISLLVSWNIKPFPTTLDALLAKLEGDCRIEQSLCEEPFANGKSGGKLY